MMEVPRYQCNLCDRNDLLILDPCVFGLVYHSGTKEDELKIRIYLVDATRSGSNYVQVGFSVIINSYFVFIELAMKAVDTFCH